MQTKKSIRALAAMGTALALLLAASAQAQDRKSIRLAGDVAITGAESRGEALIRTEHLSYDIDDAIVQTEDPVSVRFGQHLLKARGLRAELNAGTLKLESDVNGRFAP